MAFGKVDISYASDIHCVMFLIIGMTPLGYYVMLVIIDMLSCRYHVMLMNVGKPFFEDYLILGVSHHVDDCRYYFLVVLYYARVSCHYMMIVCVTSLGYYRVSCHVDDCWYDLLGVLCHSGGIMSC